MPTKITNQAQWASALLGAEGDPNSKTNVQNIEGWEALEGGNWNNTAKFNPLNTSELEKGSVNYNTGQPGQGVQAYKNWKQGLDATTATLSSPDYGYPKVLADLNTSQPWSVFLADLKASSWDAGHYAGVSSGSAPSPSSGGGPSATAYGVGTSATDSSGSAANSPSSGSSPMKLTGMAGILQALDNLYNPQSASLGWNPIADLTALPTTIEHTSVMIFVRGTSALLSVGLIAIGLTTMLKGSTSGGGTGGSGGGNVLEFVNNAKIQNTKLGQAEARSKLSAEKEEHVVSRHADRLANDAAKRESYERIARTPKVNLHLKRSLEEKYSESHHTSREEKYSESHIHHHKS